jgi:histidine phosphotransfer protein HptB
LSSDKMKIGGFPAASVAYASVTRGYISRAEERIKMTPTTNLTTVPAGELSTAPCYSSMAGDPDMAELLAEFVGTLPQRLAEMRQAAQGQNWPEVRRLAHQLRGAGGSYGFPLLTTAAARVETIAKEQANIKDVRAALDQLTAISQRLRA